MADDDRWREDRDRDGRYDEDRHRLEEVRRAYGATSGSRFDPRDRADYGRRGFDDRSGYARPRQAEGSDRNRGWDEGREARDRGGFWGHGQHDRGFSSDRGRQYSREDYGSTAYGPQWRDDSRSRERADQVGRSYQGYGGQRADLGGEFRRSYGGHEESRDRGGNADRGFFERATDEVSSWFGDRDAEQRREQDHRGRGPKGYRRSDSRMQEDINDRLADDAHIDASDIDVTVSDGEVTLSGTVDSRNARRRAEDLAEQVSGVSYVQNNLRIGRSQTTHGTGSGSSYTAGASRDANEAALGRTEMAGSGISGATSSGAGLSRSAMAGMSGAVASTDPNGASADRQKSAS